MGNKPRIKPTEHANRRPDSAVDMEDLSYLYTSEAAAAPGEFGRYFFLPLIWWISACRSSSE
jgi:hypothetical protein